MAETERSDIVDRGWNDPPSTGFSSEVSIKPKNKLNQRIAFPSDGVLCSSNDDSTQSNLPNLPPTHSVRCVKKKEEMKTDDKLTETEPNDLEVAKSRFLLKLIQYEDKLNKRKCEEITKRLDVMEQAWDEGKLNDKIKQKIMQLSKALVDGNCDEANKLHLVLAVDYAGCVSPWLVGVKHLIQQEKNANSSSSTS